MSYRTEVVEVQYSDPARNSDKYYRVYLLSDEVGQDFRVVFQWGRRGAKGQHQNAVYANYGQAHKAMCDKLRAKQEKDYVESYSREFDSASDDVLEMAGVNRFGTRDETPSANPFVRIALDVDTCRRLAMGDDADMTKAIVLRSSLLDQLAELRTSVAAAEGQFEIVDMLLAAKVA